ncbi:MAG TPA: CPBP family intramembrane metalloprotease [Caldilineae bacterium]|nr:CPBP family intramembrane metalloprotease [Caldilineae bacterium]
MIDRKGIAAFLIITFTLTYAIEGALIWSGFRITDQPALYGQLAIVGVMWAPAFATVLTIKFITREGFAGTNLRFGSWRPYLKTALVIPAVFVLIYALTWLLGLGNPDWQLTDLSEMAATAGADISQMPQPLAIILGTLAITLVVTPFINSLVAFGEELGWRGYLLPKLMPLGKTKAYLLMGVIWGLWHAPLVLIGFNYPGYPILGVLWMIGLMIAMGVYLNELTLRNRSTFLAAWMHGVFNSQGYGIWRLLFPAVNPLWGGMTGLIAIAAWLGIGLWEVRRGQGGRT